MRNKRIVRVMLEKSLNIDTDSGEIALCVANNIICDKSGNVRQPDA